MKNILTVNFFDRDCLDVAPELVGKILVRKMSDGTLISERIAETEAYRGEEDKACHASKGKTPRTKVLYGESGRIYVYLCYGLHYLMNVVTGGVDNPQCVLIRAGAVHDGPAKLTKFLNIDKKFNGCEIYNCGEIWVEDDGMKPKIRTAERVGIDYADEPWRSKKWRFIADWTAP